MLEFTFSSPSSSVYIHMCIEEPPAHLDPNSQALNLKLPRIQTLNIGTPRPPLKQHLSHQTPRRGTVLNPPARVARRDPQPGNGRPPDQGPALLPEPHVPRQVARLLRLDRRGGQDGRDGGDVRRQVVALRLVGLYLVCCLGEGDGGVGFACVTWSAMIAWLALPWPAHRYE